MGEWVGMISKMMWKYVSSGCMSHLAVGGCLKGLFLGDI